MGKKLTFFENFIFLKENFKYQTHSLHVLPNGHFISCLTLSRDSEEMHYKLIQLSTLLCLKLSRDPKEMHYG